jgi:hypothetical protein
VAEQKLSCVEPVNAPLTTENKNSASEELAGEIKNMTVMVGKPAPDFEAGAFIDGGFKNVKLSDYKGRWVVLCFYPGDFTFV